MQKTILRNNIITNKIRFLYFYLKNYKYRNFENIHKIKKNGIILVSHDGNNQGAEILLLYMAKFFYEQGIPLVIILRESGVLNSEFANYGYTVVMGRKYKINRLLKYLYFKYKYNKVILNTVVNGDLAKIFKANNYNVITCIHELDKTILELNFTKRLITANKYSDLIIFPSNYVMRKIENNIIKLTCNTHCMAQGLFLTKDNMCIEKAKNNLMIKYTGIIKESSLIVLGVGFASNRKGTDIFFDMAYEAYITHQDIIFIWVGDNIDRFYVKLKREKQIDNLPNLITPGYINDSNELNIYYHACDIFCLSSREEPFGSVILEAYNAHKPVIAFEDSGGYTDIVINNESGLLAKKHDYMDLYKKILILKNTDKREKLGNAGYQKIQNSSFEKYCYYFLDFLNYKK